MIIKRGPQIRDDHITPAERAHFHALYMYGAWPLQQARQTFGEPRFWELVKHGYLIHPQTDLGRMVFLLARGRIAAFGTCDKVPSFGVQLDRAYTRLAMTALNWSVMSDQTLCRYDKTGRMVAVSTPYGPALVAAVFGSGSGYTREGIERLVTRLRSSALCYGFRVIVITPNARRGQQLAAKHSSWLHVVPCLPRTGEGMRLQRQRAANGVRAEGSNVSDRVEKIQAAKQALLVDTVLSHRQLRRYYGLDAADFDGVPFVETLVRPVHARYGLEVITRMYVAGKRLSRLHDYDLAHRAGVAEIRHQLGVPAIPGVWEVEARGRLRYEEPDAVWRSDSGDIAIENDVGSYTMRQVDKKVSTFQDREFSRIIWGATSAKRAARLERALQPQGVQVLTSQWWLGMR